MDEIKARIRTVEDRDRGRLPSFSYSKLDLLEQCSMRYKFKYVDQKFSFNPSVATEVGSLLHKALELKCNALIHKEQIDYNFLIQGISDGFQDVTEKGDDFLIGVNKLSEKYLEEWNKPDNKSGMNYSEKIQLFIDKVLPTRIQDKVWKPLAAEKFFEFVWRYGENPNEESNAVIIHGFIDRIDYQNQFLDGTYHDLCVTDYKTSKSVYDAAKTKTPMQFFIYNLACLHLYGELPKRCVYDFICLNQTLDSDKGEMCTRGWQKRAMKKLNNLLNKVDELEKTNAYKPSPTPLCYWCDFCASSHTPNASEKYNGICDYYSLWTPENRIFDVNKKFGEENSLEKGNISEKRRLIF